MGNIANVTNFTVYKEGDGISFQTLYETASQWPCPSGYHIPTKNEMQYVFDTLKTLEGGTVTAQNLQDHLFIPPVGYIDRQTGQQSTSYGVIRLWTCAFSWAQCYAFKDDTGGVGLSLDRPATGMQIRPFANQPIAPDSSWTTPLSIGTASISVNHTLGLISITADGVKYITLSDKNLGATAYYNGTVSSANTGHYYQAGNNYGFDTPITKTSGTKVDTTGYWPGNYYNSDTYICGSSISDWRTKSNDNLWGGVGIAKGVSINVTKEESAKRQVISVYSDANNPFNVEANTLYKASASQFLPDNVIPLVVIAGQSNADWRASYTTLNNRGTTKRIADNDYDVDNYFMRNNTSKTFNTYNVRTNNWSWPENWTESSWLDHYSFDPFFARYFTNTYNKPLYAVKMAVWWTPIWDTRSRWIGTVTWNAKVWYFETLWETVDHYLCQDLLNKIKNIQQRAKRKQ